MISKCDECGLEYDDLYRYKICPHEEFQMMTTIVRPGKEDVVATSIEEYDRIMGEEE